MRSQIRLEDLDFKNIPDDALKEFIFQTDTIQGRRFGKLMKNNELPDADDALEIAREGILRHLIACLNMNVRPDVDSIRETIDDALKGKAVFSRNNARSRIVAFRKDPVENLEGSEADNDMAKRRVSVKKVRENEPLSEVNKLYIFVPLEYETTFSLIINGQTKFVKLWPVERLESFGGAAKGYRSIWSVVNAPDFVKTARDQIRAKGGRVSFKLFTDPLSVADCLAKKLGVELTDEVKKALTSSCPIVDETTTVKENEDMLVSQVADSLLPSWIYDKAQPGQEWSVELERLFVLSRNHSNHGTVSKEQFTAAAFKGLCGSNKAPGGTMRAAVAFCLQQDLTIRASTNPAAEIVKALKGFGLNGVQEGSINIILRDLPEMNEPVVQEATPTMVELFLPGVGKALSSALQRYFHGKPLPHRLTSKESEELRAALSKDGVDAKGPYIASALSKFRSVRAGVGLVGSSEVETPALSPTPPKAEESVVAKATPETVLPAQANTPAPELVVPQDKLTIRSLILANCGPGVTMPTHCVTMKDFYDFLLPAIPTMAYKSLENALYTARREAKDPSAKPAPVSASARLDAADQIPEPAVVAPAVEAPEEAVQFDEIVKNEESPGVGEVAQAAEPVLQELVVQSSTAVPQDSEDKAVTDLKEKIGKARKLFDEIDADPNFARLFIALQQATPLLAAFSDLFPSDKQKGSGF